MAILKLTALVGLLLSFTTALPLEARQLFPQSPDTDPFYNPPAGYEKTAPGTILRKRSATASFFGTVPNPVLAYQLLYRTTAVNGSAISTVTTVFQPAGAQLVQPDRFISFHTAYDSAARQCNPSYTYQLGAVQTDLITSAETLVLEAYLASGYVVAAPDYEGPEAAFSAGHLSGMAVLDGMRAVKNFRLTLGMFNPNPAIVGTGYSGGGIATGWAAALAPTYAKELNIKGWASGGTPSNLSAVIDQVDNTVFSGFLPVAIAGLVMPSAYGASLQPVLDRIITDYGRSKVDFAKQNCAVRALANFPEQSILATYFQDLGQNLRQEPNIARVLADNILGTDPTEAPRAPILLYHATNDEIIPYAAARKTANQWCSQGSVVSFTTYANGGHLTTEVLGFPEAYQFVTNAFMGNVPRACSSRTVANDQFTELANLEPFTTKFIDALAALGRGDANVKNNLSTLETPVSV